MPYTPPRTRYAPPLRTGNWYSLPNGPNSTSVLNSNETRYIAFPIEEATSFSTIGIEITSGGSAGSVVRLGIYRDNAGLPDTVYLDAGTVASTAIALSSITTTFTLTPGIWWGAVCGQGAPATQPTIRTVSGFGGAPLASTGLGSNTTLLTQASVSGAFSTATPVANNSTGPAIRLKVT